jgi:inorganic triphosphatase YgiF
VDTRARAIARAGYAARLRQDDGRTIFTLKSTEPIDDGMADRVQLEGPGGPLGEPSEWPPSPARARLVELVATEPLEEVVALRQRRHQREYGDDTTAVEVSVDDVDVLVSDSIAAHFAELEVELLRGDGAALTAVRSVLDADSALRPARRSKLEHALEAARRHERRAPARPREGNPSLAAPPGRPAQDLTVSPGTQLPEAGPAPRAAGRVARAGRRRAASARSGSMRR